jgi:LysM repeat protein
VARVTDLSLAGEQLALSSTVVSKTSKNRVWDNIKSVAPSFADLKHDIQVVAGEQLYTVQPGDNLSNVSQYFYGIAKANGLDNPDKIKVGHKLTSPPDSIFRRSPVGRRFHKGAVSWDSSIN